MQSRNSLLRALLALSTLLWSGAANATIITYNLDVPVASAPNAPGSFPSNPWSFLATPGVFSGTFTANSTVAGPISDLNLTIGGLDIVSSFPIVFANAFDPATGLLTYGVTDSASPTSGVGFGDPLANGSPLDYAVAVEFNYTTPPIDPYNGLTQNWVGTYSITPVAGSATIITYNFEVTVTDAPNAPGAFPSNPWSFESTPEMFSGTFAADDTVAGPISDLNLTIGELDIASSFPIVFANAFDPASGLLTYGATDSDTSPTSGVGFGNPLANGSPLDYAVAVEFNYTTMPLDPYNGLTQNWVGTYSVTAVPEPSMALLLGAGAVGMAVGNRKKKTGMA